MKSVTSRIKDKAFKLNSLFKLSIKAFILFVILFCFISPNKIWGQTSVFSDNFSTNQSATWTTSGAIGTSTWSAGRSGADWGARRNTSPAQLELTNDVGATANVLGYIFASTSTSSFVNPYNQTLNLNSGLITWTFNMRQITTDPGGFVSGSYGSALILASNSSTSATLGSGYAVVLGQPGATDPLKLVSFVNGLQGTQTSIITSNTTGLTDFGNDYLSVKVTYNPTSNLWELFVRNDGATAFVDPTTGSLTSQGTAVNSSYTNISLGYFGAYWQGSTSASQTAFFDNINITIACTTTSIPQTCDFTSYTGSNLTTNFPYFSEATGTNPSGTTSIWTSSTSLGSQTTAVINLYTNTRKEWIIGPTFAASSSVLEFKAAITDYASGSADASGMQGTDDKVIIRVRPCGGSWADVYTFSAANTVSLTNTLTDYSIDLSAYNGQTITIAFYATDGSINDSPDYDFHIDNINITTNCTPAPTAVTVATAGTYCASTTLTASGGTGGTIYWQNTTSNGTSTATASSSQTVSSSGTYYFRAYNGTCWGTQGSAVVTINTPPTVTGQPANASATTITSATFTTTATGTSLTYQWQECSNPSSCSWANISNGGVYSGATGATLTLTNPTIGMNGYKYRCIVSGTCTPTATTDGNATLTVTIAYCTSIPSYTDDEEIYSVTINGATNAYNCTTVAPGTGSILNRYSNFTSLGALTTIQQGETISFTILEDECDGASYYDNGAAIWIDYNQNGIFTDAGEQVFVENSLTYGPRTITGSFDVPATASTGNTRMRIIVAEDYSGINLTPCMSYDYGETEDYLISITTAVACSGTPTAGTAIASSASVCSGGTSNLSLTGTTLASGLTYQWQLSTDNNTFSNIVGATSATYTATISVNTYFRCVVTCTNSGQSSNSTVILVPINSITNDLPCNATSISIGGIESGDNTCATGGDLPSTPSCWTAGTLNTVWYSIVAPASGKLKIKTILETLTNTQIALYEGTCGSLTLVTSGCNDDGYICDYVSQSILDLSGLTAGATYFLAIDGYNNLVGTFSVQVIDGNNNWPAVPQQDCITTTVVCNSITSIGNPGFIGTGNNCDLPSLGYSCLEDGELNSAWYQINIASTGDFIFTITPIDATTDYDWALWDITDNVTNACSLIQGGDETYLIRCNSSANEGVTGLNTTSTSTYEGPGYTTSKWCQKVTTSANDVYLLHIQNWSSNNSGFTLDLTGSSTNVVNYASPTSLTWTGATSTDWFTASNWGSCVIPSCNINVVITNGPANQPIINAANAACKSIQVISGANLTINASYNLQVCGDFENLGTLTLSPTSTVVLDNGSAIQNINGTITGTNKIGNLTINKTGGYILLNQDIDIGSNFTTSNSTSILNTNGKNIKIAGNFSNAAGNTTFTNIGTTGSLEFNGSAAQTYTQGSSELTLNNVIMSNTSSGLTLNSNMILGSTGNLTLNSGKLNTNGYLLAINNTSGSAVSSGNSSSYVNGTLRRYITTNTQTYPFPVGTSTYYRLAEIINNNLTGPTYLDANFSTSFTNTGSINVSDFSTYYTSVCTEGIWSITPNTPATGGNYGIKLWFNGGGTNPFSGLEDNKFGAIKRATGSTLASDWSSAPGTLNTTGGAGRLVSNGYAQRNAWTSFSEYAIAKSEVPLPIELLNLSAICKDKSVSINWQTASETNNNYFVIEKSIDGTNFTKVNQLNGAGNSNTTISYESIDNNPFSGISYYRLKQVDFDGTNTFSELLTVNCFNLSDQAITISTSPYNDQITISINNTQEETYIVTLIDQIGKRIFEKEIIVNGLNFKLNIPKGNLSKGIYNFVIRSNNEIITKQIPIY